MSLDVPLHFRQSGVFQFFTLNISDIDGMVEKITTQHGISEQKADIFIRFSTVHFGGRVQGTLRRGNSGFLCIYFCFSIGEICIWVHILLTYVAYVLFMVSMLPVVRRTAEGEQESTVHFTGNLPGISQLIPFNSTGIYRYHVVFR
jgi:hypothetical protein